MKTNWLQLWCDLLGFAFAFGLALVLFGCGREPVKSPLVQVAEWPTWQARPEPAHCSGFAVITPEGVRVLTAAHCMLDHMPGDRVALVTRERWEHTSQGVRWARVLGVDVAADVAVLLPEADALPELDVLALADRDPVAGELVRVESGRWWATSRGTVEGVYYEDTGVGAERWAATATVAPGWSGSPVLDVQGRVLGVVTACHAGGLAPSKCCLPGFLSFEAVRR